MVHPHPFTILCLCVAFSVQCLAEKAKPVEADFSIEYFTDYKVVKNIYALSQGYHATYILYKRGTVPPKIINATYFATPIESVAVHETISITFMELLGLRPLIHFVGEKTVKPYVTSPCINWMIDQKKIDTFKRLNSTKLYNTTVVFGSHFQLKASQTYHEFVADSSSLDEVPLRRSEWLKFFAAFFDKEKEAHELFERTWSRYMCHSKIGKQFPSRPVVAWVSNWGSNFYISSAKYKHNFVADAGGKPFIAADGVWTHKNKTSFFKAIADIDILIDESYHFTRPTYAKALSRYNLSTSSSHKLVKEGRIYRLDGLMSEKGGMDWFESSLPEADVVLEDLLAILHPEFPNKHGRVWLRRIKDEEIKIEHKNCTLAASKLPLVVRADECVHSNEDEAENSAVSRFSSPVSLVFGCFLAVLVSVL